MKKRVPNNTIQPLKIKKGSKQEKQKLEDASSEVIARALRSMMKKDKVAR